jgi:60 kDa SS-A/Ro ribonucleoprotein
MHPIVGRIFDRVIDNGRMLRNFVQVLRSGVLGRKSFGTAVKRLITKWLNGRSDYQIFRDSVGNNPSLVDVINMIRPAPETPTRAALYGYMRGRPPEGKGDHKGWDPEALPSIVKEYEAFKAKPDSSNSIPNVPFQMLDSLGLDTDGWSSIAAHAKWQMTRMNLNTFKRHGVLEDKAMVNLLAARLSDKKLVEDARVFPYQLLTAYKAVQDSDMPIALTEALQDAMEHAIDNVPDFGDKRVVVCPDVSGSMGAPVTGDRRGSSSVTTCVDVSALISSAILRRNRGALVLPFAGELYNIKLNPRDTVMTTSDKIGALYGGATNCSLPLHYLNQEKINADLVVFVSDYESWLDSTNHGWYNRQGPGMAEEWGMFKVNNPRAKLMCIDITPTGRSQVKSRKDVLQVGGFSDQVFKLMHLFLEADDGNDHWVDLIKSVEI